MCRLYWTVYYTGIYREGGLKIGRSSKIGFFENPVFRSLVCLLPFIPFFYTFQRPFSKVLRHWTLLWLLEWFVLLLSLFGVIRTHCFHCLEWWADLATVASRDTVVCRDLDLFSLVEFSWSGDKSCYGSALWSD